MKQSTQNKTSHVASNCKILVSHIAPVFTSLGFASILLFSLYLNFFGPLGTAAAESFKLPAVATEFSIISDGPYERGERSVMITATNNLTETFSYIWNWGDGSPEISGTESTVSHVYAESAVYTITAGLVDVANNRLTRTLVIDLPPIRPIVGLDLNGKSLIPSNEAVSFEATIDQGDSVTYTWDMGDGTPPVTTTTGLLADFTFPDFGIYDIVVTAENPVSVMTSTFTAAYGVLNVTTSNFIDPNASSSFLPEADSVISGSSAITLADSSGFSTGNEVLLLTMDGVQVGTFETATVSSTVGNTLILVAPVQNSYAGTDKIVVQKVPHYDTVTIADGASLTAPTWDGQTGGMVAFEARVVTIEAGGEINLTGKGYQRDTGPGLATARLGSSHGGAGYASDKRYGIPYTPTALGSGGSFACIGGFCTFGGHGGGAIFVTVDELFVNDGQITASGTGGQRGWSPSIPSGGGGTGGSVYIVTPLLEGSGEISADGGSANSIRNGWPGATGAGGRVAVLAELSNYQGTISANTGSTINDAYLSFDGTVYLGLVDPVFSTAEVGSATTLIDGSVATVTVTLKDQYGMPAVNQPVSITVSGMDNSVFNSVGATVLPNDRFYALGRTDSNGVITGTVLSTKAESKTIVAWSGFVQVLDYAQTTFVANVPSAAQSILEVLGPNKIGADGVASGRLQATIRDEFDNVISDVVSVTLSATDPAVAIMTETVATNSDGQIVFNASSLNPNIVDFQASVLGELIPIVEPLSFVGAELDVVVSGRGQMARGLPIVHTISVRNIGFLPAEDTVVTVTLPTELVGSVLSLESGVTNPTAGVYVWDLSQLAPQPAADMLVISSTLSIDSAVDTSVAVQATASTSSVDVFPENNTSQRTLLILQEAPQLSSTLSNNSIQVLPNGSSTLTVTLTNNGTAALENARVNLDGAFPWLTLPVKNFGTIPAFGGSVTFAIEANPGTGVSTGFYNSDLSIVGDNLLPNTVLIRAYVQPPFRDLVVELDSDLGDPLSEAFVTMVSTRTIYTIGDPIIETVTVRDFTDANGRVTFANLETGKGYVVSATATDYQNLAANSLFLSEESESLLQAYTLSGIANLSISPNELNIFTAAEDDQAQTVVLENKGVSHLTNIQIQAPQTDVDFAYIGRVTTGTVNLAPGEAYTITFNTSVPEGKPDDVYSDNLTISADQLDPQQIPVNVEVDNGTLVDYCIDVYLKPLQTTLKGVRATLTERSSTELPFQREAYTDAINGMACFQQIPLDSYQVAVDWQGSQVVNEAVDVTFFSDSYKRFEIDFPPVEATWVVEPTTIVDVYTSTLTLDYRPKSPPILSASPREVRICQQDAGTIMETVTIHNFFPVEFTNVRIGLGYLGEVGDISATLTDPISGDSVAEGDILEIGSIAPNQDYELQLEAVLNQATCSNASGTVFLRVFADYQSYLPNGWYDVDQPIASVPLGLPASVPLKIAHRGYPEESNLNLDPPNLQNVTLTPPQVLTWMDISETKFDLIEVGTDVTFTLDIDAPEWLPNGIYQDYIVITSTNGITTVIGIEAERTDLGLEVETRFVTPLTVRDSNIPGNSLSPQEQYFAGVAEVFGSATVVEGTTSFINDTFTLKIGCKDCDQPKPVWRRVSPTRLKAVYVGRPPRIVSVPKPGPEPEPINRTILELSQGFALEREAFDARLSLANSFPVPIEDVTVNISISDREDELGETVSIRTYTQTVSTSSPFVPNLPDQLPEPDIASNIPDTWRQSSLASFVMTPKPPTRIGDVAGNEETEFSWTLIPDATGIEDENGVPFYVQASIAYSVNVGSTIENYTLDTVPAEIFVRPQPLIMLDYYLPTYVLAGQEFEWIAYISNVGYGAARDLQITTPQPKIISTEGLPVDFVITNVGIGAPSTDSDPAGLMSAAKGSVTDSGASFVTIPPGRTIEMKIKVVASEDGAMAGASVDCTHRNYRGVELPPLIYCNPDVHFYDTNYLYYGEQQTLAKEECFTSQHQTFEGDPVNTFSGNFTLTEKDLMIPAWGDHPLKFERSYNALTQDDPGPFGPGWTHNYHMSVEYRPFISRDTNGNLLQSNLLSARLPHGSRVYFAVDENAEIVPLPGVRAQITETLGSYVVTQDCDQSVYKFDTIIFGDATARPDAVLTEMIDAHGNSTTFEYEPTHGYLTKVIEPGGREVTFEYVQNGDDWLVQSMTDPLGRTATYSYTDGYMTSATDFRGFTTVYSYTAHVDGQVGLLDTIFDPDGNIIVDNNYDESGRVTWQEDALGKRTSFIYAPGTISGTTQTTIIDPRLNPVIETYNEIGALVSREDALGQISTYEYDEDYNLIEVVDRNGQQTAYDWTDCNCNVSQIIDSLGFSMDVTYNEQKEITSIKDKRNATTTIEYDASGLNAERIIDPLGNEKVYTHGPHGEILTAEDANGNVTVYSYDAYGNNIAITDALGQQTRIAYDPAGRVISTTNGLGETTEFVYDAENNLLELRAPLNATTTYAYDSRGNMTSMTDALGRTTTYGYNGRNEQVLVTDALGNTISMTYDGIGNLKTETDQNGNTRTFDYDALNRVETVIDPLDGTMTFTYDSEGNVLSETDPNGNTTTYQYVGNRVITTYADGSQMTADYDPEGNLVSIVDDLNRSVAYVYDLAGRLTTQTNALLDDIGYAYDPAGNMIAMTDELGRVTDYEYDALNRVVTTTNPISGTTVIDYDAIGQRTGLTDPNGNSWAYVYDPLHRLTEAIDPLNGRTRYSFDLVGNVRQIIDPLGRETTVAVDDLNRTIEVVNPLNGTIQYGYDDKGIVTSVIDSEGRLTSFEHDDLDRLETMINPVGDTIGYTYDANGNMLSRTDEEGRTTTYDYDSLNQQVRMTDPLGGTVIYNYDDVGNLERFTDPNNHTTVYTYDQLDRVVQVRDPRNSTMSYVYDKVGNLTSETDFENNTQTYAYDAFNRLTAATNPLDQTTRFGYDLVGNMTSVTDADDETSTYGYDALNRATAITNPLDETVNYKYDAVGNQTVLTDTLGRATTFGYDGLNRLTTVIDPLGQTSVMTYSLSGNLVGTVNPAGQVTVYNYDPLDRVENIIDPLNQVTAFRYDKVGNQTRQTDPLLRNINFVYDQLNRLTQVQAPLGRTVTYTYDPVGNQLSMTDANTHRTNFVYDELNRLTQAIDPLSAVTSYTYDRNGNPLTITDPLGRAISYGYDGLNRPETLTDPEGNTTEFRYDDVGNQTEIIDARGFSTSFDYDALGRPIAITDAISGTLLLDYDEAGNQVGLTDALGRSTTNIYDDLDRLVQTINPLGEVTEYAYDPIGNLTSVTDALDRVTGYQYDRLNRPTLITDPLNNTIEYQYDPIGNVLAQIDPLGNMTAFQYDALNQPTRVTDALNGVIQYEYDPVGNVTAITDANGHRSTLGYDPLNRLERTTSALNEVTQYVYDLAGQNTSTIDPLGYTTQFSYDDVGRLETVIDPLNRATSYSYDPVGNPLEMTDGNGIVTRYAYDPLSRLASVTENYLPSPTADHQTNVQSQFSYDAVGNLTAMTNPLGNTFTFGYDALNRLEAATDPLGNAFNYGYDSVGNLDEMTDANGQLMTYQYDALDRLTQIQRPDELVTFAYDAVGNRLSMTDPTGVTQYVYDDLYRLTSVTDPQSQVVGYGYDPVGNRTSLTYPTGETVSYSYDAVDRLIQVDDWSAGQTAYNYDANSRLTNMSLPNDIVGTFGYDDANQLTQMAYANITETLQTYTYTYDSVGNRTQAIEQTITIAPEEVPQADFTAAPVIGGAPLTVTFSNQSLNGTSYLWDFGDGETDTTTNLTVTHIYSQPGTYTVTLEATNGGLTHVLTRTGLITVLSPETVVAQNGELVFETENPAARVTRSGQNWSTLQTQAGAVGQDYEQLTPDIGNRFTADIETNSPELVYNVYFEEAGTYTVWARGSAPDPAGDSFHIGLNGTATSNVTGFGFNEWGWSSTDLNGVTTTLTVPAAGSYTVHIWGREDGLRLDRIVMNLSGDRPTADGPDASPLISGMIFDSPSQSGGGIEQQLVYTDLELSQKLNFATLWSQVLANLGTLMLAPLALAMMWAARTRRKELARYVIGLVAAGWVLTAGIGVTYAQMPHKELEGYQNTQIIIPQAMAPLQADGTALSVINYSYDPLYRLTGATNSQGADFGYSYDAAGNRLTQSVDGVVTDVNQYDAANRLSSVNGVPLSYDNNGNLLSDGTYSYSYDSANRLKQMSGGTSITNYAYNGDGLHVLESLDGIDTVFVQDVAASLPHVLSASSGGSRTLLLWGLNLIGESAISAGGADWQFMLPDAIGSVRQITDMSGQVTLNQMYDPFGNVLTSNGAADSRYGFTGEEQADSGHVYLRSRTYNPASGRFLQQDMVFGDPSSPRTMHRYAYGFNNPVNYTDPSGRMPAQGGHAMPVSSGRSSAVGGGYVGGSGAVSLGGSALAAGGLLGGIGSSNGSDGQSLTCFIQDLSAMYGLIKDAAQSVGQEFGALVGVLLEAARDPAKWGEAAAEAQNHIANINVTVTDTAQTVQTIAQNNRFIQNTLAAFEVAAQIGAQVLIALSPFDEAYDAVSLYLGYDLISGEVLSDFEKKLIIGGMVLGLVFSVGDAALTGIRAINNVVQNSRVARNSAGLVDDLGGLGLAGARSLENISAGRHVKVNVKTSKTRVANNESNVISSKKNKFTQIVKTGYEINKLGIDPILIFRSSMLDSEAIHEIASFAAKNGPKASHKLINLLDRLVWLNYDRFIDAGSITKRFRRKMFNRFKKSSINENIQIARDELAASVWWDELFSKTPGSFPTKEQLFDLGHVEQYWLKRLPTFDEMRLLTAASKREFGVRPNRATNAFPYVLDVGEFSQVNVLLDEDFIFHTHPRDVGLLWPIPSPADREVFNLFEVNNITSKTKYVHHGIVIPEKGPVIRHRGIDEPIEIYFGTAEELVQ